MTQPYPTPPLSNQPPKASPAAVWSLVLGILSITCLWLLGSIPAIILGVKGMKKADADPQNVGGKGIALAGVITGSVGIFTGIVSVAIAASFVIPGVSGVRERAYMMKDINNVRQVMLGINTYAADNDGKFPEKLMDLYPDYIATDELFYSSTKPGEEKIPYLYRPGFTVLDSSDEPIILSPKLFMGNKQVVGFVGGHVLEVRDQELSDIVQKFE